MISLVSVAVFLLLWLHISQHREHLGLGRLSVRGAFVIAFVCFEALVTLITEIASVGHHLSRSTVIATWVLVCLALLAWAAPRLARDLAVVTTRSRESADTTGTRHWWSERPFELWFAVGVLASLLVVLVVEGALYPPNNGDSMVYHLTRVVHWIQDRSVAHFATHYLAQIEYAPLAEFNLLHLHLLSGGDRLDGYVQLLAAIVCVVGASEVARLLGGSVRAQVVSAVVCATVPSVLLEATSTQTNVFAAAIGVSWLVVLLAWTNRRWWIPGLVLGLALGLAWLAKGTLLPMLGPVAALLVVVRVIPELSRETTRANAVRRCLIAGAVGVAGAMVVAGPFIVRNVELFGSPSGPVSASNVSTDLTPEAAAANVVRSIGLNFRIGNGHDGISTLTSDLVLPVLAHGFNQFGIANDDPRYFLGSDFEAFTSRDYSLFERLEDYGANPWHVLLLLASAGVLVVALARGARDQRLAVIVAAGLACGFILFSATARWNVFATRYHIPLFVAWSPIVGLALARLPRAVAVVVLSALVLACSPQLLDNGTRSLVHPTHDFTSPLAEYFNDVKVSDGFEGRSVKAAAYERATRAIRRSSCRSVGISNWILVEYPLWVGLQHADWSGVIEHVDVSNESSVLEDADFQPCAYVQENNGNPPVGVGRGWRQLTFDTLSVWIANDAREVPTSKGGTGKRVDLARPRIP